MEPLRNYIMPIVSILMIQAAYAKTSFNLSKVAFTEAQGTTVNAVVAHQSDPRELAESPNDLGEIAATKARP